MNLSFSEAAWSAGIILLLMAPKQTAALKVNKQLISKLPGLLLLLLRSADVVLGGGPELAILLFDDTELATFEAVLVMDAAVVGGIEAPKSSKSFLSLNSKSNMSGLRSVMSWMRSCKVK